MSYYPPTLKVCKGCPKLAALERMWFDRFRFTKACRDSVADFLLKLQFHEEKIPVIEHSWDFVKLVYILTDYINSQVLYEATDSRPAVMKYICAPRIEKDTIMGKLFPEILGEKQFNERKEEI